jgi:hypothetical protein
MSVSAERVNEKASLCSRRSTAASATSGPSRPTLGLDRYPWPYSLSLIVLRYACGVEEHAPSVNSDPDKPRMQLGIATGLHIAYSDLRTPNPRSQGLLERLTQTPNQPPRLPVSQHASGAEN